MRRLLVLCGVGLMLYGAFGLLTTPRAPRLVEYLGFLAAGVVGHDLLLAPLALLLGGLLARLTPPGPRAAVVAGLFATLAVSVIALPLVLGYGKSADNPSVLPLPYGRNLAILLLGIWTGVAVIALLRHRWRRRSQEVFRSPADLPVARPDGDSPCM